MTEFSLTDAKITLIMTLFLILISFVYPAVGFTSDNVTQSDIPSFNLTEGTFDFVQTVPQLPDNPTEGTLRFEADKQVYEDNRRIWLEGNTNDGYEITLINNGTLSDPLAGLFLNEYNNSGFVGDDSIEMDEGDSFNTLERDGYVIAFSNVTFTNEGQSNMTMRVDWETVETRGGASAVSTIPIIGGTLDAVASAIGSLGAIIGWIGSILYNLAWNFIVFSTNLLTVIYNVIAFITGLGWWLVSTYGSVVSNAPASWASLLLSIPGLLLSYEFAKLVLVIKQQIPFVG